MANGRRMKLWKDRWCGDIPLREAFPKLFSVAITKDLWVTNKFMIRSWRKWRPFLGGCRAFY